jgi:hypothetical protein
MSAGNGPGRAYAQTVTTDSEHGVIRGTLWFEPSDLPSDNRIGQPIPTDHSGAIGEYWQRLEHRGLPAEAVDALTDVRGEDCVPPWGSQICTNGDPCPEDAGKEWWQASCAEFAAAFPHRFRAGAAMRHAAQFADGGVQ